MNKSDIEKSYIKRIIAWYGIAPYIWNCLIIGLCLLVGAVVLWFFWDIGDPEAAGAIMVGVGIVAQVHYSRLPLRVILNDEDETSLRTKHIYNNMPGVKQVSVESQKIFSNIWKLVTKKDFVVESSSNPINKKLMLELVVYRVDKRLEIAIGSFTILGTIIWGYGGEFFKAIECYRAL